MYRWACFPVISRARMRSGAVVVWPGDTAFIGSNAHLGQRKSGQPYASRSTAIFQARRLSTVFRHRAAEREDQKGGEDQQRLKKRIARQPTTEQNSRDIVERNDRRVDQ